MVVAVRMTRITTQRIEVVVGHIYEVAERKR